MKRFLFVSLTGIIFSSTLFAQTNFMWEDTTFTPGQSRNIFLRLAFDGPCTVYPCYDYDNNKLIYDTLISFLNRNIDLSVALIWHTRTMGNSVYHFNRSKKGASGLVEQLTKSGINEKRMSAIGLGESKPLFHEDYLNEIKDGNQRSKTDLQNERVEIIITATGKKIWEIH